MLSFKRQPCLADPDGNMRPELLAQINTHILRENHMSQIENLIGAIAYAQSTQTGIELEMEHSIASLNQIESLQARIAVMTEYISNLSALMVTNGYQAERENAVALAAVEISLELQQVKKPVQELHDIFLGINDKMLSVVQQLQHISEK
jgi:hypothetical protein